MLALYARLTPEKIGAADLERKMTFRLWHSRACRLANAFFGLGLGKGDRVCVLAYNCLEWLELYAAAALAGLVVVPINFRLTGAGNSLHRRELRGAGARRAGRSARRDRIHSRGAPGPAGELHPFRRRLPGGLSLPTKTSSPTRATAAPAIDIEGSDPWTLMYTSGTTGRPKGAIRNHQGGAMLSLVTEVELGISRDDAALLVMPICHANSLYFFGAFAYCGAACTVYSRKHFDPEHLLRTLAEVGATFTSLVPTHYAMMLDLPAATWARYNVDSVTKLMISSAPARRETKLAVMEHFRNSGLFELYGSTEAGWVTMLHPEEQLTKLGSVGRECVGSRPIRLLDARRQRRARRRAGRALLLQPLHVRRLLEAAGQDEGSVPRRILHGRRHGAPRC